jgi:UDP-N-acetylmuramoyl-L-alanyl-D-glutamate--2,6-diaminopimelate ligase
MTRQLSTLLASLTVTGSGGALPDAVEAIAADSRAVSPGALFVAVRGTRVDGHAYLEAAARAGAAVAVVEEPPTLGADLPLPWVRVPDAAFALSALAAAWHGEPGRDLTIAGVTGTNGKTTTAFLLEALFAELGMVPGLLSTVVQRWPGHARDSAFTTPDALQLHGALAEMSRAGARSLAMEVSSHALEQRRAHHVPFAVAAFTNLGIDHLDYHGDAESYFRAKLRLFTEVLPASPNARGAAVCVDSAAGRAVAERTPGRVLRVGQDRDPSLDVWAEVVSLSLAGTTVRLHSEAGQVLLHSPLVGRHNVENLAVAAGCGLLLGVPLADVARGLSTLSAVPGRLQRVSVANPAAPVVFVDYAHTADALDAVLRSLRQFTAARLVTVFGCGGDRDRSKRPLMGKAAGSGSDFVVVTSDNPRSEDPHAIAAEAARGLADLGLRQRTGPVRHDGGFAVCVDRAQAIVWAIEAAGPGGVVLVAGKGHEKTQETAGVKRPFDDVEVARAALATLPLAPSEGG